MCELQAAPPVTPKPPRRRTSSAASTVSRRRSHDDFGGNIDLGLDKFANDFFGVINHASSSLAHSLGDKRVPLPSGYGRSVDPPWESAGHGHGAKPFPTPPEAGFTETPFHFQESATAQQGYVMQPS